jgi:serine/threonine protein kinase
MRIADGKLFALKFTEPKEHERAAIENEIGIMQMNHCDSIVRCHEAFDF